VKAAAEFGRPAVVGQVHYSLKALSDEELGAFVRGMIFDEPLALGDGVNDDMRSYATIVSEERNGFDEPVVEEYYAGS
jgi:hypothetical protein